MLDIVLQRIVRGIVALVCAWLWLYLRYFLGVEVNELSEFGIVAGILLSLVALFLPHKKDGRSMNALMFAVIFTGASYVLYFDIGSRGTGHLACSLLLLFSAIGASICSFWVPRRL